MTDFILTTVGTMGDVAPFLRIGSVLRRGGKNVTLITHACYAAAVKGAGLDFHPIDTLDEAERFLREDTLWNSPQKLAELFRSLFFPKVLSEFEFIMDRCRRGKTALVTRASPGIAGLMAAERANVPVIPVYLSPTQIEGLPIVAELFGSVLGDEINGLRRQASLEPVNDWMAWLTLPAGGIAAWPDWFAAPADRWPKGVRSVGFLLDDDGQTGELPAAVENCLRSPGPTILIAGGQNPHLRRPFHQVCVDACGRLGLKAILVTRHIESVPKALPAHVVHVESAPFATLIPRIAAVLHHGGMGTLGRAVAAGVPQVVLPYGADRPDNGSRLKASGLAECVLPTDWNVEAVAKSLSQVLRSATIRENCRKMAERSAANSTDSAIGSAIASLVAEFKGWPQRGPATPGARPSHSLAESASKARPQNYDDVLRKLSPEKRALFELRLGKAAAKKVPVSIPSVSRGERSEFPLSFAQERLFFLDRLRPGVAAYSGLSGIRLKGRICLQSLARTLEYLVSRHEMLRARFKLKDGVPSQSIRSDLAVSLGLIDLSSLPEAPRDAELRRVARAESVRAFDLGEERLFRSFVVRLSEREHVFVYSLHHIVSDGWSHGILVREFASAYNEIRQKKAPTLPPLKTSYLDFACWQREQFPGPAMDGHLQHWIQCLKGMPSLTELPADYTRPAVSSGSGDAFEFSLSGSLTDNLKELGRREGATLFMTLLAGLKTLLHRYTGESDLVVGAPAGNRSRQELEDVVGLLVNTVLLRTRVGRRASFRALLLEIRRVTQEAFSHQDLPFEKLVEALSPERGMSHNPLFQIMFGLVNTPRESIRLSELEFAPWRVANRTARFDLEFLLTESGHGVVGEVQYSTDLFRLETIGRLLEHYKRILAGAIEAPDCSIDELSILSDAEREQLLIRWNDTATPYPRDKCIHQLFEERALQCPDSIALAGWQGTMSYAELNARSNRLAHYLRAHGVGIESRVAICMERSFELVIAMMGILKAGGVYVPIDPDYPEDRVSFMLNDADAAATLTQRHLIEKLPAGIEGVTVLDAQFANILEFPSHNPANRTLPANAMYVIYTSGSTGRPKGVINIHQALSNRLIWMQAAYGLEEFDVVLQKTPFSFDVSVWEFFWPLLIGARLTIAKPGGHRDPAYLIDAIATHGVTTIHFVPSMLQLFLEQSSLERCGSLKRVICSGEALSRALQDRFYERLRADLHNLYGPTEAAVDVTAWSCNPRSDLQSVPIGRPISNAAIYILDRSMQPAPEGVPGELFIGGEVLARGYHGRADLTADAFAPDPFSAAPGARMYRTGDVAKFLRDGNVDYLGRRDEQVKVRGIRIELGEIESALSQHPFVRECVVSVRGSSVDEKSLIAHLVLKAEAAKMESHRAQVQDWQGVFDRHLYGGLSDSADPRLNFAGWNSSYTGEPIPTEEMHEWLDDTVERIRLLKPRKALELGCGTGLVLFGVAPLCEEYWASDFSPEAISYIRRHLTRLGQAENRLTLLTREADDFEGLQDQQFDGVILNSVIQYFPDLAYLQRVLDRAIALVRPGGFIFLGDVRSLPLAECFHASVEFYNAPDRMDAAKLRHRISERMAMEDELFLAPRFFVELKGRDPRLRHLQIFPKRMRSRNELSMFRYQVVLHVGGEPKTIPIERWLDWGDNVGSADDIRRLLKTESPATLGVRRIRSERLASEVAVTAAILNGKTTGSVGELRKAGAVSSISALDAETVHELGEELGYRVEISCAAHGSAGEFDASFCRRDPIVGGEAQSSWADFSLESAQASSSLSTANTPLSGKWRRFLVPRLRKYLQEKLPEYMVPSAFVVLPALPLGPNGKIDRKELPVSDAGPSTSQFNAPRTPVEKSLAVIWKEVLGLERVGIDDNFFELGGDSIQSIRILNKAYEIGLELTPRDVFQHQTIRSLAEIARGSKSETAPEAAASGPVPLTPIQRWFFDQSLTEPEHFNQSILLSVGQRASSAIVRAAFLSLAERHDSFRLRFQVVEEQWSQFYGAENRVEFLQADLTGLAPCEIQSQTGMIAAEAQRHLNLESGPIARAVWLERGQAGARLLVVVHHLVIDAVSWRTLLEDLEKACESLIRKEPVQWLRKTASYGSWARRLEKYAGSPELLGELPYWETIVRTNVPSLPTDRKGGVNTVASARTVSASLTEEETTALLRDLPAKYRTRINEALLAALVMGYKAWSGNDALIVDLEGHGREDLFEGLNISHTVGWFTTIYPVVLEASRNSTADALKSVKEQLRRIPNGGLGFGVLKYMAHRLGRGEKGADIRFNYLGQVDRLETRSGILEGTKESIGPLQSPLGARPYLVDLSGLVVRGQLHITWTYSDNFHQAAGIEQLSSAFLASLRELIGQSRKVTLQQCTPSDFPLAETTQEELEELLREKGEIADIYPLSPMQEGMVFHAIQAAPTGTYFMQWSCVLQIDEPNCFKAAWRSALDRFAVLRTSFRWAQRDKPVQIVQRTVAPEWHEEDWSDSSASEQAAQLEKLLARDASRGFDLQKAPLLRFALIRLGQSRYRFVWSHHHILLDGWSVALVLKEVFGAYDALCRGALLQTAAEVPYRSFIEWIQGQDLAKARDYWTRRLSRLEETLRLISPAKADVPAGTLLQSSGALGPESTKAILNFARSRKLTVNTLIEASWALLLSAYGGGRDIVFGTTMAGRPVGLRGADSIVGLFINTLPRRVSIDENLALEEWLAELQSEAAEMREYSYTPLVQVQALGGASQGKSLFESILVFENYPTDSEMRAELRDRLGIGNVKSGMRTNYPFTLLITANNAIHFLLQYDSGRCDPESAQAILADLAALLTAICLEGRKTLQYVMNWPLTGTSRIRVVREPIKESAGIVAPGPRSEKHAPFSNIAEEILVGIFCRVLGLDQVGPRQNFFELGGQSLRAVQVVSRIRELFEVELPIEALFDSPTAEQLARKLTEFRDPNAPTLTPPKPIVGNRGPTPLSPAQERLWFLWRLNPRSIAYNISSAVRVEGDLDVGTLKRAVSEVIRRHEALRLSFGVENETPFQFVREPTQSRWQFVDLANLMESEQKKEVARLASSEASRPFDLHSDPLLRTTLVRLGASEHAILYTIHHIVADGWSLELLMGEVSTLYAAFRAGGASPLPDLPVQYSDFAAWQRDRFQGEQLDRSLQKWRDYLHGAPTVLELPTNHARPQTQLLSGARLVFRIPPDLVAKLKTMGVNEGISLYGLTLASFGALLHQYTAQDDILIGTVVANRMTVQVEELIGFFVNTLVVRLRFGSISFRQLLKEVKKSLLFISSRQDIPLERVVSDLRVVRDPGRSPLFQTMLIYQNYTPANPQIPGLRFSRIEADVLPPLRTDLDLYVFEDRGMVCSFIYNPVLFDEGAIERLSARFLAILTIVADRVSVPLAELFQRADRVLPTPVSAPAPKSNADNAAPISEEEMELLRQ